MKRQLQRLLEPEHLWHVGRGKARSQVMLLEYPHGDTYTRPGVPMLFLSELWVPPHARGRGYASTLLTAATDWADETNTDLWLYIAPNGPEPRLNTAQLEALYHRHGFRTERRRPDVEMVRRWRWLK